MNTKIVSQWRLPKDRAEQLGLQHDIEAMATQLIARGISAFLAGEGDLSSPICQLLQACFAKVNSEFHSERWIRLIDNIFVDKQAKGFWIINNKYGSYSSGIMVSDVEKEINKLINDKVNSWVVASEDKLKCLYNLISAPFNLSYGRPSYSRYYIHCTAKNRIQGRDFDNDVSYCSVSSGHVIPYLPFRNADKSARSVFIDVLSKGFTPKKLKNDQTYLALLSLFHRKQNLFSAGRKQTDTIIQQLVECQTEENIIKALLQEDKQRADITPYHDKLLRDTGQGHWSLWQDELETGHWETIRAYASRE